MVDNVIKISTVVIIVCLLTSSTVSRASNIIYQQQITMKPVSEETNQFHIKTGDYQFIIDFFDIGPSENITSDIFAVISSSALNTSNPYNIDPVNDKNIIIYLQAVEGIDRINGSMNFPKDGVYYINYFNTNSKEISFVMKIGIIPNEKKSILDIQDFGRVLLVIIAIVVVIVIIKKR